MSSPVAGADDGRGIRVEVTRGGPLDASETAALATAIVELATADRAEPDASVPAWMRAALVEGTGAPRVLAPADLGELGRR